MYTAVRRLRAPQKFKRDENTSSDYSQNWNSSRLAGIILQVN